ncbi:hypothetical protein J6590_044993 [Homalodisca vitripennis]|nr:hypothetical protein J6590_044993 [Homalodisca vitripennis]
MYVLVVMCQDTNGGHLSRSPHDVSLRPDMVAIVTVVAAAPLSPARPCNAFSRCDRPGGVGNVGEARQDVAAPSSATVKVKTPPLSPTSGNVGGENGCNTSLSL